jgi:hypothetical protein
VRFFPKTSSVNWGVPAGTLVGKSLLVFGAGLLMYPPQDGSTAVTNTRAQKASRDFPCKSATPV